MRRTHPVRSRLLVFALAPLLALLPATATAQMRNWGGGGSGAWTPEKRAEWQVKTMAQRLKLSEAQKETLTKLLAEQAAAKEAQTQKDHKAIEATLTPEQVEAYRKTWNRTALPKDQQRPVYDREANALASVGLTTYALRPLELSASQTEQITKLLKETGKVVLAEQAKRQKAQNAQGQQRRWGSEQYKAFYKHLVAHRDAVLPKIYAVLTPDQKEKLAKQIERRSAWIKRYTDPKPKPKPGTVTRSAPASPEERAAAAIKPLGLTAEEAAVLQPMVAKLLRFDASAAVRIAALRRAISKLAGAQSVDGDALQAKVKDLRKALADQAATREALEGSLRELVTFEQEAKLIGSGVLR